MAEPQLHGLFDRPVHEIQLSGDARAGELQAGYLAVLGRSVDQQRPQHLGAHGPLGAPGGAGRGVVGGAPAGVGGGGGGFLAEVDALAERKGLPDPAFRGRQTGGIDDRPHFRAAARARATPGSFGPRNCGSGLNTASSRAFPAANTSRVPP